MLRQRGSEDEVCLVMPRRRGGQAPHEVRHRPGTPFPVLSRGFRHHGAVRRCWSPRRSWRARSTSGVAIFFTDGVDTASQMSPRCALRVLEGLDDPVYVFGIERRRLSGAGQQLRGPAQRFAELSGGRCVRASTTRRSCRNSRGAQARADDALHPRGRAVRRGTEKWRKVEVGPATAQVQTRQGYKGTLP
jgi:hypothetical protein